MQGWRLNSEHSSCGPWTSMVPVVRGRQGKASTELRSDAASPNTSAFLMALVEAVPVGPSHGAESSCGSSGLA